MTDIEIQPCIKQLALDEGYRPYCYDDATGAKVIAPKGKLTTAIGLNLQDSPITYDEAIYLLTNRVRNFERQIDNMFSFYKSLDIVRQSVILNMTFNLGFVGFTKFGGLIGALRAGDYAKAHDEILDSDAARKLVARYQRLAIMMSTGMVIK